MQIKIKCEIISQPFSGERGFCVRVPGKQWSGLVLVSRAVYLDGTCFGKGEPPKNTSALGAMTVMVTPIVGQDALSIMLPDGARHKITRQQLAGIQIP